MVAIGSKNATSATKSALDQRGREIMAKNSERKPTFKEVHNARKLLMEQGEKPTYKRIIEITGGNNAVLKKHLDIIESVENLANFNEVSLPDPLLSMIKSVIAEYAQQVTEGLQQTIEELKRRLESAYDQLSMMEAERDELREQLADAEKQFRVLLIELEKQLAAAQQRIEDLRQALRDVEQIKERMTCELQQAKALEIDKIKHQEAEQRLREKIAQLEKDLAAQADQIMQLVQREAALGSRVEDLRLRLEHSEQKCEQSQLYIAQCESRLEALSNNNSELSSQHAAMSARLEEKTEAHKELGLRLRAALEEISSLKETISHLQADLRKSEIGQAAQEKRADIFALKLEQAQAEVAKLEAEKISVARSKGNQNPNANNKRGQSGEATSSQ